MLNVMILTFLGGGGNKLRKLEFYLGAAKQAGCDTIIAMGTMQSNHARLSAAAALSAGLIVKLSLDVRCLVMILIIFIMAIYCLIG